MVISAVLLLFHPKDVFKLWKMNRHDGIVAITVFFISLIAAPDYALLIGVLMSLIFFLWKTMRPSITRISKDPYLNMFVNADLYEKPSCPQLLHLRSDNVIYFANAGYTIESILGKLDQVETPVKYLLLDLQAMGFIDITGIDELRVLMEETKERQIKVAYMGINQPVRETFKNSTFIEEIEPDLLIENRGQAIQVIFDQLDHQYCREVCPYTLFNECPQVKGKKKDGDSDDASWAGQPIHFPRIQGADVCGHIVAVGTEINASRIGERVLIEPCLREANKKILDPPWYFGSECDGGFAEYTLVAARHAYKIDSDMSDTDLASFPCAYATAENLLTRANVQSEERVLVTGASGGVGSAAVQLAKARGAYVWAMTRPSKSDALHELGADKTVFRETDLREDPGTNSVDAVIDLVAGDKWPHYLEVLRPGGRYAVAGAIAGPLVELDVRTLYLKDLSLFGCTVLEPEVFANLIKRIEHGDIKPLVAQTYRLEEISDY